MRNFYWDDGFTPYSATLDGHLLTEYAGDVVERVSMLTRDRTRDTSPVHADYPMADDLAIGPDVDGVDVAWIDGEAHTLSPRDFECCADGTCGGAL